MSIPTQNVTITAYDPDGVAISGATVLAKMIGTDVYQDQLVANYEKSGTTNASGVCVLALFPNVLGEKSTYYRFTVTHPTSGRRIYDVTARVPNAACNLTDIAGNVSTTSVIGQSDVESYIRELSYPGLIAKVGADQYALRTIQGTANQISVTSGTGAANPTLSLPSAVTMPGSLTVTTTFGVNGNVTLGDAVTDAHTVNGAMTALVTAGIDAFTALSASGGDRIALRPQAAGSGGDLIALNNNNTDFEPLTIRGEYVATKARTGVATDLEITRVTSTGLAVTGTLSTTGNATVGGNAATNPKVIVNGADASNKFFELQSAGVTKWQLYSAATTHALILDSALVTTMTVTQAGAVSFPNNVTLGDAVTDRHAVNGLLKINSGTEAIPATSNGDGYAAARTDLGLLLSGKGSSSDFLLTNGIGQSIMDVPTGELAARFYGALSVNGNVTLGDATADAHVVNGSLAQAASNTTGFAGYSLKNSNANLGIAGIELASDATYYKAAIGFLRQDVNGKGHLQFYVDNAIDAANWSTGDLVLTLTGNAATFSSNVATVTVTNSLAVNGNVTLGDAVTDSHNVNGLLEGWVAAGNTALRLGSSTGDKIRFAVHTAGNGAGAHILNNALSDFEPFEVVAEHFAVLARTGIGTTSEITRVTSTGLDITQAGTGVLRFGGANTLQRVVASGDVTLASSNANLTLDTGTGSWRVTGAGPHAIGRATAPSVGLATLLSATAAGASATGASFAEGTLTASANLDSLRTFRVGGDNVWAKSTFTGLSAVQLQVEPPSSVTGTGTITNASTVKITGAPSGAANNYALWSAGGRVKLDTGTANVASIELSTSAISAEITSDHLGNGNWYWSGGSTSEFGVKAGGNLQFKVAHTASANRYLTVTGSNGGDPTIGVSSGNLRLNHGVGTVKIQSSGADNGNLQIRHGSQASGINIVSTTTERYIETDSANAMGFKTSGGEQFRISHVASAVNFFNVNGNVTGSGPFLNPLGTDTDIAVNIAAKGAGSVRLYKDAGGTELGRFDGGTVVDGSTALLIRRNVGGVLSLQAVSMGAADSGGAGFKLLRVPN